MAEAILISRIPLWPVTCRILIPASTRQQAWQEAQNILDTHCAGQVVSIPDNPVIKSGDICTEVKPCITDQR